MAIGLICEFFEGVENSVGTGIDRDRRAIAPGNDPLSIEHKQRAFADPFICAIGAVFPRHFALGFKIGEQRKVQPAVAGKGSMAPDAVDRDTQQLSLVLPELRKNLVVQRHLIATNRAPVGRIERQYYGPSSEAREREVLIRGDPQRESGAAVPAARMDDISCLARVERDGSFGTATLQLARLRVVDCSQLPVPPCSGHPMLHPGPYCDTRSCITYFYGTQFCQIHRTFLQRDSSPCAGLPTK